MSWLLVACGLIVVSPANVFAQITASGSDSLGGGVTINFGDTVVNTVNIKFIDITASSAVTFAGSTTATDSSGMAVDTSSISSSSFSMVPDDDGCKGRTLAALESCRIVVRFTPTAESSYAGYIKLRTTSPAGYPGLYINLKGKGLSGGASTQGTLSVSLVGGTFSPITKLEVNAIEGSSATNYLTLRATGGPVSLLKTSTPVGWGFNTDLCGTTVQVGIDCVAKVDAGVALLQTGTYFEKVVLQASDGPHVIDVTVSITGKSTLTPGSLTITPKTLDFGSLRPGTKSVKSLTLTASGSNVAFETLEVPEGYTATHSCGTLIPAGSSCSAAITFAPTAVIPYYGSAIFSTAATSSPHTVVLTGAGGSSSSGSTSSGPLLILDSAFLEFGEVAAGASNQKEVKLSNRGGSALSALLLATGDAYSISGSCISPDSISGTSASVSIAANSACTLSVKFSAKSIGEDAGSLKFSGTGADGMTVSLKGVGTATGSSADLSGLTATPTAMVFGAVNVGASLTKTVSLTKAGGAKKPNIGTVSVPSGYAYQHDCATTVSNVCTLTLIFTPTNAAKYDGLVIISDADGASSLLTVTGVGAAVAQMTAKTRMAGTNLDVTGQFAFSADKAASAGNLYVAALYKATLYFMSSGQWTPYVPGQEPPAYTTADASSSELTILVNQDVSSMSGAVLYLGYGRNIAEVINQRQYTPVHVID